MKQSWQIKNQINETDLLIYGTIGLFDDENDPKEFATAVANIKAPVLNIRINSGGGDLFAGHAMYNIIKSFNGLKRVFIDGLAASAASIVAMAGDEVIMPANTLLMIHNAQTVAYGDSSNFKKLADDLDKMNSTLVAVYQQKTGLNTQKIQKMLNNETWLTAEEALELGFATKVVDSMKIVANSNLSLNGVLIDSININNKKLQQFFKGVNHDNNNFSSNNSNGTNNINNYNKEINVDNQTALNITIESLKKNHFDIYTEIFNAGIANGINTERERIKAIDELPIIGYKDLVYSAKYKDTISPEILALQIIKAEKTTKEQYLANLHEDAEVLNNVKPTDAPLTSIDNAEINKLATIIANKINSKGVR